MFRDIAGLCLGSQAPTENFGVKGIEIQAHSGNHYLYYTDIGIVAFLDGADSFCTIVKGSKEYIVSPSKGRLWLNVSDALSDILDREVEQL